MSYSELSSDSIVSKTIENLKAKNFNVIVVDTKEQALEKIKELIPAGASVMNGASKTLEHIGYIDYLKANNHGWNNLHAAIVAEQDPTKKAELRKQAVLSDYYLGSVHAITQEGQLVIASNSGSQMPHIVYTSPHVIFIVGTHKITTDLNDALKRLEEYVIPREDVRMKEAYGMGTLWSKTLIYNQENPHSNRTIQIIFVKAQLGF